MSPPQEFAASSSWLCSRAELSSAANNWWRGQPCCVNCYGLVSAWFCTFCAAVAAPSAFAAALSCCGWGCHCHQHWQQSINIQKVGHTVLTAIGECACRQFSIGNPSSFCSSSLSLSLRALCLSLICIIVVKLQLTFGFWLRWVWSARNELQIALTLHNEATSHATNKIRKIIWKLNSIVASEMDSDKSL